MFDFPPFTVARIVTDPGTRHTGTTTASVVALPDVTRAGAPPISTSAAALRSVPCRVMTSPPVNWVGVTDVITGSATAVAVKDVDLDVLPTKVAFKV